MALITIPFAEYCTWDYGAILSVQKKCYIVKLAAAHANATHSTARIALCSSLQSMATINEKDV